MNLFILTFLILAYAETHYRFRFFVSFLKKKEPEVLADVPFRIEPREKIPVLVLTKDANQYPIILQKVSIKLKLKKEILKELEFEINEKVSSYFWYKIFETEAPLDFYGELTCEVLIYYEVDGKEKCCKSDNYRTSSHKPFKIWVAKEDLPKKEGWVYGDIHYHSSYTDDHVEFGAPLAATKRIAKAMGLNWFAVTDHSYDLDDYPENYLKNDTELSKWRALSWEVGKLNQYSRDFAVILGEEVSCGNEFDRNVHLLALGIKNFIRGMGDSAEEWFETTPTLSIGKALHSIREDGGIAFAAHPLENVSPLQKKLLNRGNWQNKDLFSNSLKGFQVWNGNEKEGFWSGVKFWKKALLKGEKKYMVAGNDAHGNFNRFRQIDVPFFSIKEKEEQVFGKVRTAIFCDGDITPESCINSLSAGRIIVTNGPFLSLEIINEKGEKALIGDTITAKEIKLNITAISTAEFGTIQKVKILRGKIDERKEELLYNYNNIKFLNFSYSATTTVDSYVYLRGEIVTQRENKQYLGFTNPIWIMPDPLNEEE